MERREDDRSGRAPSVNAAPRKPYVPPQLRVYGKVAELTRTLGKTSKKTDGGSGTHSKTG